MKIYLVSRPTLDQAAIEDFLCDESTSWRRTDGAKSSEELIELSGRVCYFSFGKNQSPRSNEEYIRNLIENGHESVLEHAVWTFFVTGISRSLSHQIVRHRVGFSFSQLSQQYHDESEASFVIPQGVDGHAEVINDWKTITSEINSTYKKIQNRLLKNRSKSEISKEELRLIRSVSRSILPNATETKIAITANTRALRNFLKTRGVTRGDLEMRRFCCELLPVVEEECPSAFYDLKVVECEFDGLPIVEVT